MCGCTRPQCANTSSARATWTQRDHIEEEVRSSDGARLSASPTCGKTHPTSSAHTSFLHSQLDLRLVLGTLTKLPSLRDQPRLHWHTRRVNETLNQLPVLSHVLVGEPPVTIQIQYRSRPQVDEDNLHSSETGNCMGYHMNLVLVFIMSHSVTRSSMFYFC